MSKITGDILNLYIGESSFSSGIKIINFFGINSSIFQTRNYIEYNFDISHLNREKFYFSGTLNGCGKVYIIYEGWSTLIDISPEDKFTTKRLISFLEKNGIALRGVDPRNEK